MDPKITADSGTEWAIGPAKRILARLKARGRDLKQSSLKQVQDLGSGVMAYIQAGEFIDRIRLTGGGCAVWMSFLDPYPSRSANIIPMADAAPTLKVLSLTNDGGVQGEILYYSAFGHQPIYNITTTYTLTYATYNPNTTLAATYVGTAVTSTAGIFTYSNWPVIYAYSTGSYNNGVASILSAGPMPGMPNNTQWAAYTGDVMIRPLTGSWVSLGYEALLAGGDTTVRICVVASDGEVLYRGVEASFLSTGGYGTSGQYNFSTCGQIYTGDYEQDWSGGNSINIFYQAPDYWPVLYARNTFTVPDDCTLINLGKGQGVYYRNPIYGEYLGLWDPGHVGGTAIAFEMTLPAGTTYEFWLGAPFFSPDFDMNFYHGSFVSDGTWEQLKTQMYAAYDSYAKSIHHRDGDTYAHTHVSQGIRDWVADREALVVRDKAKRIADSKAMLASIKAGDDLPPSWTYNIWEKAPRSYFAYRDTPIMYSNYSETTLIDTTNNMDGVAAGFLVTQKTVTLSYVLTGKTADQYTTLLETLPETLTAVFDAGTITVSQTLKGTLSTEQIPHIDNLATYRYVYDNWHFDDVRTAAYPARDPFSGPPNEPLYPSFFVDPQIHRDTTYNYSYYMRNPTMLVRNGMYLSGRPQPYPGALNMLSQSQAALYAEYAPLIDNTDYQVTETMPAITIQYRKDVPIKYETPVTWESEPTFDQAKKEWTDSRLSGITEIELHLAGGVEAETGASLGLFSQDCTQLDRTQAEFFGVATYTYNYEAATLTFKSWKDADSTTETGSKIVSAVSVDYFDSAFMSIVVYKKTRWADAVHENGVENNSNVLTDPSVLPYSLALGVTLDRVATLKP